MTTHRPSRPVLPIFAAFVLGFIAGAAVHPCTGKPPQPTTAHPS